MTFNDFEKRLKIIKSDYKELETKMNKVLESLTILYDDINGVYQSWLSKIIDNHLATLFMQVNPDITEEKAQNEVEYYVWEKDFGGEVEYISQSYDLSNDKQLYEYLTDL